MRMVGQTAAVGPWFVLESEWEPADCASLPSLVLWSPMTIGGLRAGVGLEATTEGHASCSDRLDNQNRR